MSLHKRAYSESEASQYICMSRSFLRQARMNGPLAKRTPGPRYIRVGRAIRYLVDDLDAWLEQHCKHQSPLHALEGGHD
ncbi:DNA-binding protein [Pseudidiomarina homiensis]|uniref:DNA-binding protein n=1 Tax=Pseudidiomarina homiensis TaxID=364198 RepID=A0A432XUF7_9GAMM|nr:DNA-binding protein [Pseudidiomarina homiensis]